MLPSEPAQAPPLASLQSLAERCAMISVLQGAQFTSENAIMEKRKKKKKQALHLKTTRRILWTAVTVNTIVEKMPTGPWKRKVSTSS